MGIPIKDIPNEKLGIIPSKTIKNGSERGGSNPRPFGYEKKL